MAASSHTMSLALKELRQVMRGPVAVILQNGYVLLVAVFATVTVVAGSSSWRPAWEHGCGAFWVAVYAQAILALLIGVSLTAASVSMEYEQKTLDTLLTTPLSPREIALGKLTGGLTVGGSVLLAATPVLAACVLLGGVPAALAVWAWVLLAATLLLAAALGLYSSALTRRTVAAVPLAIAGSVMTAAIFAPFGQWAAGLAAFSPLVALRLLSVGQPVPLLGWAAPVWAVCLPAWLLIVALLLLSATDLLKHPPLQRRLPVRLVQLVLAGLVLALVVTALNLGRAEEPEAAGGRLQGFLSACTYLLMLLAGGFAAGAPTPLDRRRLLRQPLASYGLGERLLGYSLRAGGHFLLLVLVLAVAVLMGGLLLAGKPLLPAWWGRLVLGLCPALAAVWSCTVLARLPAYGVRPRTAGGRQLLAVALIVVLMVAPLVPMMVSGSAKEPPAAAELLAALVPGGAISAALPTDQEPFASALVNSLAKLVPIPLLSAAAHLLLGVLLTLLELVLIRRWRARSS